MSTPVDRSHRLLAALAYDDTADETLTGSGAYVRCFVEGEPNKWPAVAHEVELLARIAQAIADAEMRGALNALGSKP